MAHKISEGEQAVLDIKDRLRTAQRELEVVVQQQKKQQDLRHDLNSLTLLSGEDLTS